MTPADYALVCELLHARTGVVLGPDKQYLVESRLGSLLRDGTYENLDDVLRGLRAGRTDAADVVVDHLTNHETYFFRDVHPFEYLRTQVLPEALARNPGRRVTMWSAATATGQEAYSLAMLWTEVHGDHPVSILGTDVSAACLRRARHGQYTQLEVNRGLPASLLVRHFTRDGLTWRIDPGLRRLVTFREMNLVRSWPALPGMDVILLRNVLTYFDVTARLAVLTRAEQLLRPGGVLFIGGAETTVGLDFGLRPVRMGKTVCYRKDAPA